MVVAVQQPQRKESDIDQIIKGLQIVGGIFNIKAQMDQAEQLKIERDRQAKADTMQQEEIAFQKGERERKAAGIFTPGEISEAQIAGQLLPAQQGKGDINILEQRKQGEIGPAAEPRNFQSRYAAERETLLAKQEADALKNALAEVKDKEKTTYERTASMQKEYRSASKETQQSVDALSAIEIAAANPDNDPTKDMALIYAFMRAQDPGSTVREGEYATAENAKGIPDRIRDYYNKSIDGARLNPEQRQQFLNTTRELVYGRLENQLVTDSNFENLAREHGVKSDLVINPLFGKVRERLKTQLNRANAQQSTVENKGSSLGIIPEAKADNKAPKDPFSAILGD